MLLSPNRSQRLNFEFRILTILYIDVLKSKSRGLISGYLLTRGTVGVGVGMQDRRSSGGVFMPALFCYGSHNIMDLLSSLPFYIPEFIFSNFYKEIKMSFLIKMLCDLADMLQ